MDQWLVRTHNNVIAGPFSKDQVVQLIREGQLSHQDEVCRANEYWIALHEREEVMKQLGIEIPKAVREDGEEVTETQTESITPGERTDPDLSHEELAQSMEHVGENTAVINRGTLRAQAAQQQQQRQPQQQHSSQPPQHTGQAQPTLLRLEPRYAAQPAAPAEPAHSGSGASHPHQVVGESVQRFERPAVWRSFAWLLIVVVCLIVFAVLRVLKSQPV